MSQPTIYDRQSSFTLFSSENPGQPHPGYALDSEFNAVKLTLDETLANLRLIQSDDGKLARQSVGREQLDESITLGFSAPETWESDTTYTEDESTVFYQSKFYICIESHISGVSFEPANWEEIADFTLAAVIDDGSITAAKLADSAVETAKINNLAVTSAKLSTNSVTEVKILDEAVTTSKIDDEAVTLAKLAVAVAERLVPLGGMIDYTLPTEPSGWLFPNGQGVTSAYPEYRAALIAAGSPYGTDGSGNPRTPDLRGRVPAGKDDMGGASANRLTNADDGLNGDTLGATGGGETQSLVTANHAPYTPAGTNSKPNITVTNGGSVAVVGIFEALFGAGPASGARNITASLDNAPVFSGTPQGGTSQAFGIVQPTIILNKIIKAH